MQLTAEFVVNHLWQSSGFAVLAGVVALALRGNSAKARYWVWLCASLKFFVPFALLVSLGSLVPRPVVRPVSVAAHDSLHWVPVAVGVVWGLGFFAIVFSRLRSWLRVRAALRAGTPVELPIPVRAIVTPGAEEPGVIGFLRPVLVLPRGSTENLDQRQLHAVLSHELCHVRRRDNFFAAVHMFVEAVFWFFGSRMVEERELACVSVKKRLRPIPGGSVAQELGGIRRIALATISLVAFAAPVLIGVLNAPAILAQDGTDWQVKAGGKRLFDVASVKPTKIDRLPNFSLGPGNEKPRGGLLSATLDVRGFIEFAYKLARFQTDYAYAHAPEWVRADRYAIDAKAQGDPTKDQMRLMMQSLLADRFKLAVHFETRQLPVLALRQVKPGKLGPKLIPHSLGPPCPEDYESPVFGAMPPDPRKDVFPPTCGGATRGIHGTQWVGSRDVTMATTAQTIYSWGSLMGEIDRPVVDQTGLNGTFDFVVEYNGPGIGARVVAAAPPGAAVQSDEFGTPFVEALRRQLGLKLVRTVGPVRMLVIDRVQRPSEN